jgi:hypothetical protein
MSKPIVEPWEWEGRQEDWQDISNLGESTPGQEFGSQPFIPLGTLGQVLEDQQQQHQFAYLLATMTAQRKDQMKTPEKETKKRLQTPPASPPQTRNGGKKVVTKNSSSVSVVDLTTTPVKEAVCFDLRSPKDRFQQPPAPKPQLGASQEPKQPKQSKPPKQTKPKPPKPPKQPNVPNSTHLASSPAAVPAPANLETPGPPDIPVYFKYCKCIPQRLTKRCKFKEVHRGYFVSCPVPWNEPGYCGYFKSLPLQAVHALD